MREARSATRAGIEHCSASARNMWPALWRHASCSVHPRLVIDRVASIAGRCDRLALRGGQVRSLRRVGRGHDRARLRRGERTQLLAERRRQECRLRDVCDLALRGHIRVDARLEADLRTVTSVAGDRKLAAAARRGAAVKEEPDCAPRRVVLAEVIIREVTRIGDASRRRAARLPR